MMGFLLFAPRPRTILMIGLGGGSLPKHCHRRLGDADITVAEINPYVIALRDEFLVPPDGDRFRVVCADGADVVAEPGPPCDVLLVDGFCYEGQPERLCSQRFYDDCRTRLAPDGVMAVNLHADDDLCWTLIERIERAFGGHVQVEDAESGGNLIVFAGAACRSGSCRDNRSTRIW